MPICGSIKAQPFLNRGSNKLYFSDREKKECTSILNERFLWAYSLLHASNFIMETEDNTMLRQVYDYDYFVI